MFFFSAGCSDGRVRRTGGHQVDYEAVRPHQQLVHLQHNDNGIFEPENWLSILKRSCLCIEKTQFILIDISVELFYLTFDISNNYQSLMQQ
jgi:hypothetical protein